ncbi:ATP-binding protein [Actinomyces sp. Marseille-QA0893]
MTNALSPVLVANRGEIAVRVIRTLRELGLESIAVYAEADRDTLACELATSAYSLGGRSAAETYLNPEAILEVAKKSGARAIHPGYGFLSENADFAARVQEAGLIWVGPSPEAIDALGDKIRARALADSCNVPTIAGKSLEGTEAEDAIALANEIGYPVLIKRADGGGGRGITRFNSDSELREFYTNLADPQTLSLCFMEKFIACGRHVETQCARDSFGTFAVVSTRDCSVQRRNQKVVEEAPAPFISEELHSRLERFSHALFDAVNYVGVGTCEFLVEDGHAYFLEVNPRLQVEHTVSEEVTGLDLVAEQLRIAHGLPLSIIPPVRGHAIEVRVTSEDPANELMPATGRLGAIQWPGGPGVRIDSFIRPGEEIGTDFDSLIAKITVHAPTRIQAIIRLQRALDELSVEGLPTSAPLLSHILATPQFRSEEGDALGVYTQWLEREGILTEVAESVRAQGTNPAEASEEGREECAVMRSFVIEVDGKRVALKLPSDLLSATSAEGAGRPRPRQPLRRALRQRANSVDEGPNVTSPIQATVIRVAVEEGQEVEEGELVAVIESMKMEKTLTAGCNGTIAKIHVAAGDTVKAGDVLVSIKEEA